MTVLIEIIQAPVSNRAFILQTYLSEVVAKYLGFRSGEDVDCSLGFYEQGLSSLNSLEYIYALEGSFNIKLASDTLFNFSNINLLKSHLMTDKLIHIDFGFDKVKQKNSGDNEMHQLIQLQAKGLLKDKFDLT